MKVLFCFYPLFVTYNHGIALLSALCRERGIETELCMLRSVEEFEERLVKVDYDFVSFSAVIERDYRACLPFMTAAKRQGKTVLLGGVYPRRGAPLNDAPADFICRGEGELLPEFILHGDTTIFDSRYVHPDIEALPLPDYEMFRDIPFNRDFPFFKGKRVLPYYTSRGCPWKCSFCEVRAQTGTVRFRYRMKEDLDYLARTYAPDVFMIGDETLPYYNRQWRESWRDFSYPFMAYIRGDIEPVTLEWLKDRGLIGCAFGVEAGNEQYRNEILKKGLSNHDIYRTVETLNRLDISYSPFFMTDLPGETFGMKAETHRMAREIGGFPVIFQYEDIFNHEGRI